MKISTAGSANPDCGLIDVKTVRGLARRRIEPRKLTAAHRAERLFRAQP